MPSLLGFLRSGWVEARPLDEGSAALGRMGPSLIVSTWLLLLLPGLFILVVVADGEGVGLLSPTVSCSSSSAVLVGCAILRHVSGVSIKSPSLNDKTCKRLGRFVFCTPID